MKDDRKAVKRSIDALKAKLLALVPEPGNFPTAVEGLCLYREERDVRKDCFHDPVIGVIVQGDKRALAAASHGDDREYCLREGWYIAYGMDLPAISHISGASRETPHLALSIPLDRYLLSQLASEVKPRPAAGAYKGLTVAEAGADILEACLRLVRLLDAPERIPVIAPMIMREIHYYLLSGPEGEDFRLLGTAENPNNQIARAVSWLREHYRELFSLAELAAQVNMSQPSLCRHFSRITGTSPLQFQKRLRLYEAQRLMLTEDKSAETAAYEVGYDSPTQFNREYKRQFGRSTLFLMIVLRRSPLTMGRSFRATRHWRWRWGATSIARPYHSWERGLNEHTNGLIKQYLPKKTSFDNLTQRRLDRIVAKINNRPVRL